MDACISSELLHFTPPWTSGLRLTECHGSKSIYSCSLVLVDIAYAAQSFHAFEVKRGGGIVKQQQCLRSQEVLYGSDYVKLASDCEAGCIYPLCQGCKYHSDGNGFPALGALEYRV
jgi:hypothetical protein